jgi:hypothetical protein
MDPLIAAPERDVHAKSLLRLLISMVISSAKEKWFGLISILTVDAYLSLNSETTEFVDPVIAKSVDPRDAAAEIAPPEDRKIFSILGSD